MRNTIIGTVTGLTLISLVLISSGSLLRSEAAEDNDIVAGTVMNSKYLSITFHKYVNQKDADSITGTIVNNSTKDISSVRIYATLFDKNNNLITTETGTVQVPSLSPTMTTPFTITLVDLSNKPDHYSLFPGGLPK